MVDSDFLREIADSVTMQGDGAITAVNLRESLLRAILHGDGGLEARAKKYHVDSITVNGPFAPGDKIVIDSNKFRITKNGNIVGYDGDLFDINPGLNMITYKDSENGRNVLIRVSHRDRYLY